MRSGSRGNPNHMSKTLVISTVNIIIVLYTYIIPHVYVNT